MEFEYFIFQDWKMMEIKHWPWKVIMEYEVRCTK